MSQAFHPPTQKTTMRVTVRLQPTWRHTQSPHVCVSLPEDRSVRGFPRSGHGGIAASQALRPKLRSVPKHSGSQLRGRDDWEESLLATGHCANGTPTGLSQDGAAAGSGLQANIHIWCAVDAVPRSLTCALCPYPRCGRTPHTPNLDHTPQLFFHVSHREPLHRPPVPLLTTCPETMTQPTDTDVAWPATERLSLGQHTCHYCSAGGYREPRISDPTLEGCSAPYRLVP